MNDLVTIGCDPGRRTALALFKGPTLQRSAVIAVNGLATATRVLALQQMIDHPKVTQRAEFICEAQYRGPRTHPLVANATAWQVVADLLGMTVAEPVGPTTWQSTFGIAKNDREWRQEQARNIVQNRFPQVESFDPDRVAAVLIGLHLHYLRTGGAGGPFAWVEEEKQRDRS